MQGKVTVLTSLALELESWAALVDHPSCQLTTMDIRYDSDYHPGIFFTFSGFCQVLGWIPKVYAIAFAFHPIYLLIYTIDYD